MGVARQLVGKVPARLGDAELAGLAGLLLAGRDSGNGHQEGGLAGQDSCGKYQEGAIGDRVGFRRGTLLVLTLLVLTALPCSFAPSAVSAADMAASPVAASGQQTQSLAQAPCGSRSSATQGAPSSLQITLSKVAESQSQPS